ncbi:chromosome segregation protein SMC [Rhodobacterales bacterium HKCCE3408]|nr:chromosome segregation protein SMC [Rhodobacterales bacterium HKCCE3408]
MRFTRLRLNGFKSFVDPTDLVIAEGLTGVVGPNGCGKSNLLEALRWVMGENRPTAMRGGGMEDVIFAGAATRGARNFAEVALHVDNEYRLAPAAFNDSDHLEIVRRITRDAGSAYKVGGKDVRARDVQMLFADASTGAQSPALVRQGQISELINAKPKNRRRVLEDAAGISGLYQRRHEAELKLNAAEQNLSRVDDVLEQLAAQLATLARQARQAKRYREIAAELRQAEGLLLYLRWREADAARAAAERALTEAATEAASAERAAREAATRRETAEAALPPKREEEAIAGALLNRVTLERDALDDEAARAEAAISTLEGRIAQLTHDIAREESLSGDAGATIARLEDERSALTEEGEGHAERLSAAEATAEGAAEVLAEHESHLGELTEAAAGLAARHQSAARRVEDATRAADRNTAEAEKASRAAEEAEVRLKELTGDYETAQETLTAATDLAHRAEETLADTETARAKTQAQEGEARAARAEAEGRANTLDAEVRALSKLLERDRGKGDQLLDAVQVAPGFETAVGAALADDLKAPLAPGAGATGWTGLKQYDQPQKLPGGVPSLAEYADGPDALDRRLAQVGVVDAAEGARLQAQLLPGQRLVSRAGDLWRWDGYAVAAADQSSSAARRLEQVNQLDAMSAELERARAAADRAIAAHDQIAKRLKDLSDADGRAREARREAERRLTEASRAFSRLEAERNILDGRLETLRQAALRHAEEAEIARKDLAEAEAARAGLGNLDALRAELQAAREATEAARLAMIARRTAAQELKRDGEMRDARLEAIAAERAGWAERAETAGARMAELANRRGEAESELGIAKGKPAEIAEKREALSTAIGEAEKRKAAATDALTLAETALREAVQAERDAERRASDLREGRARAEARRDAAAEAVDAAAHRIAEEMETAPEALLESLDADPENLPDAGRCEADVTRLRRQRDALGAVNLRAEEDARAVQEEHDELLAEKTDLEAAIAKLRTGIASLNREGRERLLNAFDAVNANFSTLFTHLFGGGEAKLVLVESDDPLEAGLEILCQPPGKKLSTLSLLSGGEQTLTALALIFGVFLANPAPICVLDEVDAPLDDANVGRFCDLLDEMCRRTETRFLIITHHAVTMARMDRLFGVTMAEQGVSQLVSVDLTRAEQMVA